MQAKVMNAGLTGLDNPAAIGKRQTVANHRLLLFLALLIIFPSLQASQHSDEEIWRKIQESIEGASREESPEEAEEREKLSLERQKNQRDGLEMAWNKAVAYVPGSFFPTRPDKVTVRNPTPVVVFMHGCTGISNHDSSWAKFISDLGFIVIMPDSMARPGRVSTCDARLAKPTNLFPLAYHYRLEEVDFAWERLQTYPWARKDQIFLMGHSEGGVAAARTTSDKYQGLIISGWSCTNRFNPAFNGIFSPKHVPVLAIADRDDYWHRGTHRQGQCVDHAGGREGFLQVDLTGGQHATYPYVEARNAVKDFLMRLSSRN